jgi:hypothetical protein
VLVLLLFIVKAWLNNSSEISDTLLQLWRFSAIKYMKQNKITQLIIGPSQSKVLIIFNRFDTGIMDLNPTWAIKEIHIFLFHCPG